MKFLLLIRLTPLLFFSSQGLVYKIKTYKLPIGSPTSKGKALVNLLPLRSGEKITTTMPYDIDQKNIIFATSKGNIRRNKLTDFHNINVNGKIAMKLNKMICLLMLLHVLKPMIFFFQLN